MKRDFDLIRSILISLENMEFASFTGNLPIEGHGRAHIVYNAVLMIEAELLHGEVIEMLDGSLPAVNVSRITWKGHDFLDAARDNTLWNKAKTTLFSKGGAVTLDVLKAWLIMEAKTRLGLPP